MVAALPLAPKSSADPPSDTPPLQEERNKTAGKTVSRTRLQLSA
jgi:hypothetical protein